MGSQYNGGTLGGGEILPFIGNDNRKGTQYFDWDLVKQFASIPLIKALIVFLIVVAVVLIIMRMNNVKSLFKGKGIKNAISNVNKIKQRDSYILKCNKWLKRITNIVQRTPFNLPASARDYMVYNLKRADINVPGGFRRITPEEFNAIIKLAALSLIVIGILATIFISPVVGVALILGTIVAQATLPNIIIRSIVRTKDAEIRENFSDFYLMLHYVLIIGGQTPLDKLMRSYAKTTDSVEMVRFVDNCVGYIDTHGEYGATQYIAKDYREIAEVGKLMRLVKQMYDGADIQQELLGFREELIKERKYRISQRVTLLVKRARMSFNILMIVLIQAIISAMALYLPDLSQVGMFM